ncbi:MAG: DUF2871 domain-containing protein [Butyricicoccus pullicaecorum]|nr:DUF2871 domain-containing protein [Butyricicoccus pullicaecorum]
MKKLIDFAFGYAAAGLTCGVFYREFTKYHAFTGRTTLGFAHVHLLVLGTLLLLLLAAFALHTDLTAQPQFRRFFVLYQIALPATVVMLLVRGVLQVLETPLTRGLDAAISGIAGIAHILMTISFVLLYLAMRRMKKQ